MACLGPCTPGLQNEFPEAVAEPEGCLSKGQLRSLRLKSEIPISFWFLSLCIKFQKRENSHWLSILHMVTSEIINSHLFLILKPLYQISEERRSQWLFYIFYIWQTNMDVSMLTLPVHPTLSSLPSTLYQWVCSLCLHLHCRPANRFNRTIFLDSIYMH